MVNDQLNKLTFRFLAKLKSSILSLFKTKTSTDLKSFKRNVYIDFMERSLVSTGYRITGPELQRFLVDATGASVGIHPDDASGLPVFHEFLLKNYVTIFFQLIQT